jgi:hypothetical protein
MKKQIFWLVLIFSLVSWPVYGIAGETMYVELRVAKNEYLIGLCKKYLEQPEKWQKIAQINRLANPHRLSPGQKIVFPVDMLKGMPLNGVVTVLKGNVSIKMPKSSQWSQLHPNDVVIVGSSLKTGDESIVEILFEDGTLFQMRENSVVTVKAASKGALHLLRVIYLESGKIVSRVKAATGRDSRYEIKTPSAIAAARGTEYRVAVDQQQTTRAEMLHSRIDLSSMGTTVQLNEGEGSVAKLNEPPSPPRKLLPPPAPLNLIPVYEELPFGARFAKVDTSSYYRVVLARDREGKDFVKVAYIRPEDTFEVAQINDGTYYLITSSIDADGLEGPLSEPKEITVHKVRKKPASPTIASPYNTAELQSMQITVTWQPVEKATHYHVQIAEDSAFTKLVVNSNNPGGTTYILENPAVGTYYLRISSMEADGFEGEWSAVREFSVARLPAPVLEKTESSDKELHVAWKSLEGGTGYQIQVAGDEGFSEIILDKKLQQTALTIDKPEKSGKYYMHVRGIDSKQNVGSFSQAGSFEVEKTKRFPYELLGLFGLLFILLL